MSELSPASIGVNMLTNGTFATDLSSWGGALGNFAWRTGGGAERVSGASSSAITQGGMSLVEGEWYQLDVDVFWFSGADKVTFYMSAGGANYGIAFRNGTGHLTATFRATATTTKEYRVSFLNDFRGYITNASMKRIYKYGRPPFDSNTAGLIQRNKNQAIMDASMNAMALVYAYEAAASIEYDTVEAIDEIANQLDAQYQIILTSGASVNTKNKVTDMRLIVLDFFAEQRLTASQILDVHTVPTSARLLGYQYYGNDEVGESIAALNNSTDVSFIDGEVKVLTA